MGDVLRRIVDNFFNFVCFNFFLLNAVFVCYVNSQMNETDLIFEEFIRYFLFIFVLYSGDKLQS